MNKLLVSVLGQDQPGIIAGIASALAARNCNIENVSQTLLQDVFGALLIVAAPVDETPAGLKAALDKGCERFQLYIHVHEYHAASTERVKPQIQPYIVTAIGPDKQGLVADVAQQLAKHGVNIVNLQAIFKGGTKPLDNLMIFHVDVPRETVMDELRADLAAVSSRLGLEINIQHRRIFEAVSAIDN
jgi:glycine cleavage system transcriptional repressor